MTAAMLGCASGKDAADAQVDALHAEISRLQADQDRLLDRVESLEAHQNRDDRGERPAVAASSERPPLQVVVLKPESEGISELDASESVDDDAVRTTIRSDGKRAKAEQVGKGDAEREYAEALDLVRKQKQYQRAIDAFTGFLVRYPDHQYAENALFWMGESHLELGDSARALEQYEAVIARFPAGNKTPDALLRASAAYRKRGDEAKAREALERLRTRFPNSDAARRAPKE